MANNVQKEKELVVGRVDKEHLALLKYAQGNATEAANKANNASVAFKLTMSLVTEKFGLPENGVIDPQTGDVTIRERSPGKHDGRNEESKGAPEAAEPIKLFP